MNHHIVVQLLITHKQMQTGVRIKAKNIAIPCRAAFVEKKTAVTIGPYTVCPSIIFFKVLNKSRFGTSFEAKLNHKCSEGPEISIPYPAIRNVLIASKESEGVIVII